MTAVFGPIVVASDVEDALTETLKLWLPTYLAEMERLTARAPGDLPEIRSYSKVNRFRRLPQEQLPAAVVVSPGLASAPVVFGDGKIGAWWRLGVAVVCSGSTAEASNELAKLYGAAIRTLLVQRPDLGGAASALTIVSELYDDVPADYLEVGATAQVEIDVFVDQISDNTRGPSAPAADLLVAPAAPPVVIEANVDVETRSLT